VDPFLLLLIAAGLGTFWWLRFATAAPRLARFDDALQDVVQAAAQEARTRAEPLEPLHFLLALLRDEAVRRAAGTLGADVRKIEAWVLARLQGTLRSASSRRLYSDRTVALLNRTVATRASAGQSARLVELLAALMRVEPATAEACAAGGLRAVDLLVVLVHGAAEAELRVPAGDELRVVLVNDDLTPMELVVEVLEKDLALSREDAMAIMMRVHQAGRGDAGRFVAAEARERVRAAIDRARSQGAPLLLRLEAA
jgi:ATP-dependent Clp protease adaptor protein ClpS